MSRDALLRGLVGLLAVGALVGGFFSCFERTTEEEHVGAAREARENPYLALGRTLERLGHPVTTLESLADLETLPPPEGTLWLLVRRDTLPGPRAEALLDWVHAGGHLVLTSQEMGPPEDRGPDPLLDRFGLVRSWRDVDTEPEAAAPEGEAGDAPEAEAPEAEAGTGEEPFDVVWGGEPAWEETVASWPGTDRPLTVDFIAGFVWEGAGEAPTWEMSGEAGPHLVMLRHGAGALTALSDGRFVHNDRLARQDHAELALHLARWQGGRRPVWIVRSAEWPGLVALAMAHATPVLASGAALLVAWLWRASRRFGPVEGVPPPERRSWIEHLDAVGHYHWRHDRGLRLLHGLRERVLLRLERRHPAWTRLHVDRLDARLAGLTGLSTEQVARALRSSDPPKGANDFTTTIAHLERIRATL